MIKNHLKNATQLSIIVHRGKAERRTTALSRKEIEKLDLPKWIRLVLETKRAKIIEHKIHIRKKLPSCNRAKNTLAKPFKPKKLNKT